MQVFYIYYTINYIGYLAGFPILRNDAWGDQNIKIETI